MLVSNNNNNLYNNYYISLLFRRKKNNFFFCKQSNHTSNMFRNKELALLEFDELEALFSKLSPEEIEVLNAECNADPDVII